MFLNLKDTTYVDINQIEAFEKVSEFVTRVYTHYHIYEADLPMESLKDIIEFYKYDSKEIKKANEVILQFKELSEKSRQGLPTI